VEGPGGNLAELSGFSGWRGREEFAFGIARWVVEPGGGDDARGCAFLMTSDHEAAFNYPILTSGP
jgi:hypothetical protein